MGVREGTQSSNLSQNSEEQNIDSNYNEINKNTRTVYRKIDDYPIKKFIKKRKNESGSIN